MTSCAGSIRASASSSPNSAGRAPAITCTAPIPAGSSRRWSSASFIARADAYGIDYNIIEAIDQPRKTNEGGVGAYWGLFDSSRDAKFAWSGPVSDPDYWKIAGISVLLGLLMSLTILAKPRTTTPEAVLLVLATNVGRRPGSPSWWHSGAAIISCRARPSLSASA